MLRGCKKIVAALLALTIQPLAAQDIGGGSQSALQLAGFTAVWTAAGSTGFTDDNNVRFFQPFATLKQKAPAGATAVLRYSIAPIQGDVAFPCTRLGAILRDTGAGRVDARLVQVDMVTGFSATPLAVNSDDYPASGSFVTRETTMSGSPFNFTRNLYYVEVEIRKDDAVTEPLLLGLYIGKPLSSSFCPS